MQKGRTQSYHLRSNFDPPFPPEHGQNRKNKQKCGKTLPYGLSKYVKIKALSPLPFPGKVRLLLSTFGLFLPGNRARS